LKSQSGSKWGDIFKFDDDEDDAFDTPLDLANETGDGVDFLNEAHEALNRLSQKANKRGGQMKQPRRAENWD
jgi:hypothetical protein